MLEGIKEVTHTFLHKDSNMQSQAAEYPSPIRDMNNAHDSGCGRRKRKDVNGVLCVKQTAPTSSFNKLS